MIDLLIGNIVTVIAEPNIGDQLGIDGDIGAEGKTVVGAGRVTAVATESKARSAGCSEESFSGQSVRETAEAAKGVYFFGDLVVAANIPLMLLKRPVPLAE